MEELHDFFQGELEKDFGYEDDRVIEILQSSMDELSRSKLIVPPPRDDDSELPKKPFGVFVPFTIDQMIGRSTNKYFDDETKTENVLSIPADGGPVIAPAMSPKSKRISEASSYGKRSYSIVDVDGMTVDDGLSTKMSLTDYRSSQASFIDNASVADSREKSASGDTLNKGERFISRLSIPECANKGQNLQVWKDSSQNGLHKTALECNLRSSANVPGHRRQNSTGSEFVLRKFSAANDKEFDSKYQEFDFHPSNDDPANYRKTGNFHTSRAVIYPKRQEFFTPSSTEANLMMPSLDRYKHRKNFLDSASGNKFSILPDSYKKFSLPQTDSIASHDPRNGPTRSALVSDVYIPTNSTFLSSWNTNNQNNSSSPQSNTTIKGRRPPEGFASSIPYYGISVRARVNSFSGRDAGPPRSMNANQCGLPESNC